MKRIFFLVLCLAALYSCSSSKDEKPLVAKQLTGYAFLGRLEESNVEIYNTDVDLSRPICSTETSSDSQVFSRTGIISIDSSCINVDDTLYLIRITGGTDVDPEDSFSRSDNPLAFDGELRALATGEQLSQGGWSVNPLTDLIYIRVRAAIAADIQKSAIFAEMDRLANELLQPNESGEPHSYNDILAWRTDEKDLLLREQEQYDEFVDRSREGDITSGIIGTELTSALIANIPTLDKSAAAKQAVVVDNILYIADAERGLSMFDISNPVAPTFIANADVEGQAYDIAVQGGIAVLAMGTDGLVIFDVSNPRQEFFSPRILQRYTDRGNIYQLELDNNQLFYPYTGFADSATGLSISQLNAGDGSLSAPTEFPGVSTYTIATGVVYVVSGELDTGLEVSTINRANPGAGITPLKTATLAAPISGFTSIKAIRFFNNKLYVYSTPYDDLGYLFEIDLSETNPTIVQITRLSLETLSIEVDATNSLLLINQPAYITRFDLLTTPIQPLTSISLDAYLNTDGDIPNQIHASTTFRDILFVIRSAVVDLYRIGRTQDLRIVNSQNYGSYAMDVKLFDDVACVTNAFDGVTLIDVANPPNLNTIGSRDTEAYEVAYRGCDYDGRWLYWLSSTDYAEYLYVQDSLDFTGDFTRYFGTGTAPTQQDGAPKPFHRRSGLVETGNGFMIASSYDGLYSFDISAADGNPVHISSVSFNNRDQACRDISIPCEISPLSTSDATTVDSPADLSIFGNFAYGQIDTTIFQIAISATGVLSVASEDYFGFSDFNIHAFKIDALGRIYIVGADLSDPGGEESPIIQLRVLDLVSRQELGRTSFPGNNNIAGYSLALDNGVLFASQFTRIMQFDISDEHDPHLTYIIPDTNANGMVVRDGFLYYANGYEGLVVLKYAQELIP